MVTVRHSLAIVEKRMCGRGRAGNYAGLPGDADVSTAKMEFEFERPEAGMDVQKEIGSS